MQLKLNKKKIKTLSEDKNSIPHAQTPAVGGGNISESLCVSFSHGGCCGTVAPSIRVCSAGITCQP
ncbi:MULTISPECIES: hypothetical protein [Pseudoalteromonas]|uniref:Class I lanthipeptide n=1 Tax=Pseudoalteromonas luteoviolacea (strain 2ta16) TaxID=1353533 RepID=V4HSQ4_PSEL2|nr:MULTISPECIES: hypothetical protein [Pseudoalteromonas]ESP90964.1 hypothetical protein PL2TA16_01355 [Pseudoalteromonas luteoviolacea 2ta16]KZN38279.1 hypothetical protein N483_20200 [Pseudoalteromonas luteoviolacea NCIMB 1944]MCG7547710.1 hypothetical protein [Pseudoalteromonas sp. Of7M-16]